MNAWDPIAAPPDTPLGDASLAAPSDTCEAFTIERPAPGAAATPLILASPHSGRVYPEEMMAATKLSRDQIRRSEDAFVDGLIEAAPAHGATTIAARMARVWFDVNREPWELDPAMFEGELPAYARGRSARVAAGLGAIARIVAEGEEIYHRKLRFSEAQTRVEGVHRPYHDALSSLIGEAKAAHGVALLVDCHSMPAAAASQAGLGAGCDIVLGDRFGASCSLGVSRLVERELQAMGYAVARNAPYAGGYTTEHYGRPGRGVHALQIEVSRAIYMDERTLELTDGFPRLKADFERLIGVLAGVDWAKL